MKDIDNAWRMHDENSDRFHCGDDKDFSKELGHSKFNPACKRRVQKFSVENPLILPERELPDILPPKIRCNRCGKKFEREDMYRFEEEIPYVGQLTKKVEIYLCKAKCGEKRRQMLLRKGELITPQQQLPVSEGDHSPQEHQSHNEFGPGVEETASPQKTADKSSQG